MNTTIIGIYSIGFVRLFCLPLSKIKHIMASKRIIKKQLNGMVFEVVDECFSVQLYKSAQTEVTNKLIDEALDFRDNLLAAIHQAKSKKDYPTIYEKMEEKGVYFVEQLNAL